jgi:GNAT superfamily N-acetyltransferase
VGVTTLYLGRSIAGVFDVGVVERARRRGIGATLVAHACAFARDRGYDGAALTASGMGESVYREVGFREVCRTGYWYSRAGRT